jgi:hypothetical protein
MPKNPFFVPEFPRAMIVDNYEEKGPVDRVNIS